ncbi:hypothetical protein ACO0RG_001672 [Hanseniaspora osmophila]|uniref:Uncharacterized protein n=1 Tax=Hanseniaspora osmophila TaxID=56408 RepID=A0A1E5RI74_9ASCO|nr:hypothetical protein AWRI3579_g1618 [Hanseniaspora osmophila]
MDIDKLSTGKPTSIPKKCSPTSIEDFLISFFESLTSIFDQVYFLKTIGLIKESSFIYRKLYKSQTSLKVWFVSLCLNLKKSLTKLYKIVRFRRKLLAEMNKLSNAQKIALDPDLIAKFHKQLKYINKGICDCLWDVLDHSIYLLLISFDLFSLFKKFKKYEKHVERMATGINLLRFCLSVKSGWDTPFI